MAIMIKGVWVYPENLRRALVFRKLLGRGKRLRHQRGIRSFRTDTCKIGEEVL